MNKVHAKIAKMSKEHRKPVRSAVKSLRGVGVSWVMIMTLLVKYGPTIIEVVKAFIEAFKAKKNLSKFVVA